MPAPAIRFDDVDVFNARTAAEMSTRLDEAPPREPNPSNLRYDAGPATRSPSERVHDAERRQQERLKNAWRTPSSQTEREDASPSERVQDAQKRDADRRKNAWKKS